MSDPWIDATRVVITRLSEDGARPTKTIEKWLGTDVDASEWFQWASTVDLIRVVSGEGVDDPHTVWAISPKQIPPRR